MRRILCVGLATQDFIFAVDALPTRPEKTRSRSLTMAGGGLAGTAAVAAAKLGADVHIASRLGDDWIADHIVQELTTYGVNCDRVRRFAGHRSSVSAVLVTPDGERLVINYGDDSLPDDPSWLPADLADIHAVHGDTRWETGSKQILLAARTAGIPGVLDLDRAPQDSGLISAASHAAFSSQAVREFIGPCTMADAVERLTGQHGTWIAVTDGERGTWFGTEGDVKHQPAFPITPVDTLGAGDVFHGALTLALAEGMEDGQAVRFASAAAALKCTRFGGRTGAPSRQETEAFLQLHG